MDDQVASGFESNVETEGDEEEPPISPIKRQKTPLLHKRRWTSHQEKPMVEERTEVEKAISKESDPKGPFNSLIRAAKLDSNQKVSGRGTTSQVIGNGLGLYHQSSGDAETTKRSLQTAR